MNVGRRTRAHLLDLKRQLLVMRRGLDLLRSKREALLREFFATAERVADSRELIDKSVAEAVIALARSLGIDGRASVRSAGDAAKRDIYLDVTEQNVWGVRIPELHVQRLLRSIDGRGYAPTSLSPATDDAAGQFEQLLEKILHSVTIEIRLKRLGAEIKRVSRRVNALQEVLLPSLIRAVHEIRQTLEEREREDLFRLKRLKR